MSSENVELASRLTEAMRLENFVAALEDEDAAGARSSTLDRILDPQFEVEMFGPEYAAGDPVVHYGIEGYLEVWREWLAPWESYRVEPEEFLEAGDKVVVLARQFGTPKMGGGEIENRSAAILSFEGGRLARVEFHLDGERAMKAAGLSE